MFSKIRCIFFDNSLMKTMYDKKVSLFSLLYVDQTISSLNRFLTNIFLCFAIHS